MDSDDWSEGFLYLFNYYYFFWGWGGGGGRKKSWGGGDGVADERGQRWWWCWCRCGGEEAGGSLEEFWSGEWGKIMVVVVWSRNVWWQCWRGGGKRGGGGGDATQNSNRDLQGNQKEKTKYKPSS